MGGVCAEICSAGLKIAQGRQRNSLEDAIPLKYTLGACYNAYKASAFLGRLGEACRCYYSLQHLRGSEHFAPLALLGARASQHLLRGHQNLEADPQSMLRCLRCERLLAAGLGSPMAAFPLCRTSAAASALLRWHYNLLEFRGSVATLQFTEGRGS